MSESAALVLRGVSENNLKDISLEIPHDALTVVTGLSGSGKSTLAFDTIYAEGGRRYIETFSPYTRQFLDRLQKPLVDFVSGIRPALAIEQRNRVTSSRSTVGTITEINDYLKLLWSRLSSPWCPNCGLEVMRMSPAAVLSALESMLSSDEEQIALVMFPLAISDQASPASWIEVLRSQGFLRFFDPDTGKVLPLENLDSCHFQSGRTHDFSPNMLFIVLDRLRLSVPSAHPKLSPAMRQRLVSSISQAYRLGHGRMGLGITCCGEKEPDLRTIKQFREDQVCQGCGMLFPLPRPSMFSFNSPLGACPECHGFGRILSVDPALCIPDPRKSINEGAVACWNTPATGWEFSTLKTFCKKRGIDTARPWSELSQAQRDLIFFGEPAGGEYEGVAGWFRWLEKKTYKMHVRVFLSRYRTPLECHECKGRRLKPEALLYRLQDRTLPEIWQLPISDCLHFFADLTHRTLPDQHAETALSEAVSRLKYLADMGLSYLTLDRQTRTLSGGEFQRVNLTSVLGSRLVNTTLVLDEPTIGLHPRDTERLISSLKTLRDRGNTVLVVEHDSEVIGSADSVIDLGPEAGAQGGHVVYLGPVAGLRNCKTSYTSRALNRRYRLCSSTQSKPLSTSKLIVRGAKAHNLRDIDLTIPLQQFVVLSGVSGSGKSSFVEECLVGAYKKLKRGGSLDALGAEANSVIRAIEGLEAVEDIILVDQSPVGKTPRSNPATYTKAWDVIRESLAETDAAKRLGLGKSAFSFNVDGGRCPECKGAGFYRIEMQFLADVFVVCETCGGSRFKDSIKTIRYGGKNVTDFLELTLSEASQFFSAMGEDPRAQEVSSRLRPLLDLGLGYLTLGHPLNKLSGGEAQRLKLASYLASTSSKGLLLILDEPSIGLHPHDVGLLIATLRRMVAAGHSVLCVEHNLDVILNADWLVDLGPEGGVDGGMVVAQGRPADLVRDSSAVSRSQTIEILCKLLSESSSVKTSPKRYTRPPARKRPDNAISIIGARHHNLKNVSLKIPKQLITVITGVSGSGKSTLAFDILFSEGQRRYIDCLSPYARQYITQLERAEVDLVDSVPPTIAVSQKAAPPLGISTVATTTEVYQYLRLLYAKVGVQHCPEHDLPISGLTAAEIADEIVQRFLGKRLFFFAPVVSGRKGYYNELFQRALRAEISEARVDGKLMSISASLRLERQKLHWISLLVASLSKPEANSFLLKEAVEQSLLLGDGALEIAAADKNSKPHLFSTERVCPKCRRGFLQLDPQDFSFRSKRGVCPKCEGRGEVAIGRSKAQRCPECGGSRIGPVGRNVLINRRRIHELTAMTPSTLLSFLETASFDKRLEPIVAPILSELKHRLCVLRDVGLDYLKLNRESSTISGGEAQRLRLARVLGQSLSGVCYVFDEPTIGLHPSDHERMMASLERLKAEGNTVVVVEHDEDTIRSADYVIDLGPGGGARGGVVVAAGSVSDLLAAKTSATGQALKEREMRQRTAEHPQRASKQQRSSKRKVTKWLQLTGVETNNLRSVDARFPVNSLTVVAGVSGAGKSSLIHGSLVPAVEESFGVGARGRDRSWKEFKGSEFINRLYEIDQAPVGRTSSSTPCSYIGIFDDIRKLYAQTGEAVARGWNASHFSFNSGRGRCEDCGGKGYLEVPMSFLPKAQTVCEVCGGLRYNESTLEVKYRETSIGELLNKTMDEAREIFAHHKAVRRSLDLIYDLGLGYLRLGQPTHTLSGGEVQRLKIARELGSHESKDTLYILDEPSIGLHMLDVDRLLAVLYRLRDRGNTIVVIEHNMDVIAVADYLIELGPGPAEKGGRIIFEGSPHELVRQKRQTPTKRFLKL